MSDSDESEDYGHRRERGANVSYLEVEQVAITQLISGRKPSIQSVRRALGDRGSPPTILRALRRFWRDLGLKAQGDPAALSRLPVEISEVVESLWQRALALAAQRSNSDENAARAHLERLRITNETRDQSISMREREWDLNDREREKTLTESRDQLLATLRLLSKDRVTLAAQARRIAELEKLVEDYRQQQAAVTRALSVQKRTGGGTGRTARRAPPRAPIKRTLPLKAKKAKTSRARR